jgi:outer membrane protein
VRRQRELVEPGSRPAAQAARVPGRPDQRRTRTVRACPSAPTASIKQIGDAEKYDVILQDAGHLLRNRVDITKKVIDALNAGKYRAGVR